MKIVIASIFSLSLLHSASAFTLISESRDIRVSERLPSVYQYTTNAVEENSTGAFEDVDFGISQIAGAASQKSSFNSSGSSFQLGVQANPSFSNGRNRASANYDVSFACDGNCVLSVDGWLDYDAGGGGTTAGDWSEISIYEDGEVIWSVSSSTLEYYHQYEIPTDIAPFESIGFFGDRTNFVDSISLKAGSTYRIEGDATATTDSYYITSSSVAAAGASLNWQLDCVPEPSGAVLIGLAGLVGLTRRRR